MYARLSAFAISTAASTALATILVAVPISSPASAQPRAQQVPSPGRSAASSDDSNALAVNPANLSFMPGFDARWTWVRAGEDPAASARGHAFSLASPLLFGLATGFRLDFVRPPVRSPDTNILFDEPYTWLTWGLAFGGDAAGLGLSVRHLFSSEPGVVGPTTISLGLSTRTSAYLAFSGVAHDINAPATIEGRRFVDRSYTLAGSYRPFGKRFLEVGIEGRYYEGFHHPDRHVWPGELLPVASGWVPRAVFGVDVPYVGRLRADIAFPDLDNKQYVATATLDIGIEDMTITGGVLARTTIGGSDGAGVILGVAFTGWREPGIIPERYALKVRIEETPSAREHVRTLQKLWRSSKDPEIAAVILLIKNEPASSLAHAYEIDDAVAVLRQRGKKVVCHLENAGRRSLQACASADRIVINPAGGLHILGLRSERMYFAGLFRKLGVRAQFVRIGDHKSAPEQLTHDQPSPESREDEAEYLAQLTTEFVAVLSKRPNTSRASIKQAIDASPHTAKEAIEHKLVDGYAYDDELAAVVSEVVGSPIPVRDKVDSKAPQRFGSQPSIAIVYVDGNLVDGRSADIPLLGIQSVGSYTITECLEDVRKDPGISAVVLRIESPGGAAMASDVIWRAVALTAKNKPVVVSMGTFAASGGYYIAAPGSKIFATPFTLTGSIGIFYGKVDVAELLGKIGVSVDTTKTSPTADAESIYRPFTPEEVEELGRKIKQYYDIFVDRVAKGRKLAPEYVDSVGQGRVWLGRKAAELRLVDEVGGIRQAMNAALAAGGLSDDAPVVELPPQPFSLLSLAGRLVSVDADPGRTGIVRNHVPTEVLRIIRAVAPFVLYDPFQPLALSGITQAP